MPRIKLFSSKLRMIVSDYLFSSFHYFCYSFLILLILEILSTDAPVIHNSPYFLGSHIHETQSFRREDLDGDLLNDDMCSSDQPHAKGSWTNYTFDFMVALNYAVRIIKSDQACVGLIQVNLNCSHINKYKVELEKEVLFGACVGIPSQTKFLVQNGVHYFSKYSMEINTNLIDAIIQQISSQSFPKNSVFCGEDHVCTMHKKFEQDCRRNLTINSDWP